MRKATVVITAPDSFTALKVIRAYLPDNYATFGVTQYDPSSNEYEVTIAGNDVAGWTLDGYVIPRLASGLYFAKEV